MKITLSTILSSLYLFFAPVGGLLIVVGLSTILDTVSLVLIMNEVKSMDESWVIIKGYSFIDKFKASVVQIKDIKKQLK